MNRILHAHCADTISPLCPALQLCPRFDHFLGSFIWFRQFFFIGWIVFFFWCGIKSIKNIQKRNNNFHFLCLCICVQSTRYNLKFDQNRISHKFLHHQWKCGKLIVALQPEKNSNFPLCSLLELCSILLIRSLHEISSDITKKWISRMFE